MSAIEAADLACFVPQPTCGSAAFVSVATAGVRDSNVWDSYCGTILGLLRYESRLSEFESRLLGYGIPYE